MLDIDETIIKAKHVRMVFNMASEQLNSIKEYFIKFAKHELFFKELVALDDISFEIKKGEVFGLVGTNGSGKSTMLKIIAGVLEPTSGSCDAKGVIAPLIELGAGFDLELTARENIYLNGALLGYSKSYIQEHFNEIVEFAELKNFLDMPMKNYSSGMVARIAFSVATVIVPDILIVDETLSVGDQFFQAKCETRISELIKEHGVTILFVSHSIDQVRRICNRAIWIEKGKMLMNDSAEKVCAVYSYRIEALQAALVKKGASLDNDFDALNLDDAAQHLISSTAHLSNIGWLDAVCNNGIIGSTEKEENLEAFTISLGSSLSEGSIRYNAYIQDLGWQQDEDLSSSASWACDGANAGTTGKSKNIRAVQICLDGELAGSYDICYRAFSTGTGWSEWAKNGAVVGYPIPKPVSEKDA